MSYITSGQSDTWNEFARRMREKGLLKKADEQKRDNRDLYDISKHTGEDTIGEAHPDGGTTVAQSSTPDGGKVETVVEQQKADEKAATNIPRGTHVADAINLLAKIATELEEAGDEGAAKIVDEATFEVAKLYDVELSENDIAEAATFPSPSEVQEPSTPTGE